MGVAETESALADAQRLFVELERRPRAYRYLREILGGDADRTIEALDRLIADARITSRIINGDTHYEAKR